MMEKYYHFLIEYLTEDAPIHVYVYGSDEASARAQIAMRSDKKIKKVTLLENTSD